jgi:hypothetical protein
MIKKRILTHGAPLAFFFVLGVFCISPQKGSIQDHAAKAISADSAFQKIKSPAP